MRDEPFSLRLYRWMLKFYPAGFRENYAEPLEREFRDELCESTGAAALGILWIRLVADLAISVPLQISREATQDARHTLRLWSRRQMRPRDEQPTPGQHKQDAPGSRPRPRRRHQPPHAQPSQG